MYTQTFGPVAVNTNYYAPEMAFSLDEKIGEGAKREVFRSGNAAVKVQKPYVSKNFVFTIHIPTWLFGIYKIGRRDFNEAEYQNYFGLIGKVPANLRDSFMKVFELIEGNGENRLVAELISNWDGAVSRSLLQHGPIENIAFWNRMDKLEQILLERDIPYFDIRPENIVIRNVSPNYRIPVIVDYDTMGARSLIFQVSLLSRKGRAHKIKRKFERLKSQYKLP